jgi:hypothetical protein
MSRLTFRLTLQSGREGSTHPVLLVTSPAQSKRLGSKRTVNITGTLNGVAFQNSFLPMGNGRHYLVVNKTLRETAGVSVGDKVVLAFEVETAPRPIVVPADVQTALAQHPLAQAAWGKLPPSHQREYLGSIAEAKQPTTRARRVAQLLVKLAESA